MKPSMLASVAPVAALALTTISHADEPLRTDVGILAPLAASQVSDANGNPPASPDTLLYFSRRCQPGDPLAPIIAPDGHQVSLAEWTLDR